MLLILGLAYINIPLCYFSLPKKVGNYFAERHKWEEAVQYYEKASNTEKLVQCYYKLEDYSSLENLIDVLQPNDPLLVILGQMFASVGMGKQAVEAYLRCNKISSAIDTCVNLNQWHSGKNFLSSFSSSKTVYKTIVFENMFVSRLDKVFFPQNMKIF